MKQTTLVILACLMTVCAAAQAPVPLWKTLPDIPPLPHANQSGLAGVNGAQLYYAIFNKAGEDPVILLHGGFASAEEWGFEVPLLLKTHRVIVVDSRGHGRSTLGDQPLSYDLMASDVLLLMDSLQIEQASIVGWSDGGIIGLILAMKHPARINKLFTYGTNYNHSGDKDEPLDSAMGARFMARAKSTYSRLSPTPAGFAQLRTALGKMYSREPDLDTNALKKITAPTVIACGEYEQFFTRAHFETLARLIPGATLVVMPGVSHGGPIQDPEKFHAAVMALLGNK